MEIKHYDLTVCGGGMAGFAAAVSAARLGLKTAIIERFGCLGGTASQCGIQQFLGGRWYNPETGRMERKVGGLFDELTDRMIDAGYAVNPDDVNVRFNPFGWYPRMAAGISLSGEYLKYILEQMCLESSVDIFYFSNFISSEIEAERITATVFHGKSGLYKIASPLYIDATGDADLATSSGCSVKKGRESDHLTAPATLEMHVSHVDAEALVSYQNEYHSPKLVEIIFDLRKKGIWNFSSDIFVAVRLLEEDRFLINVLRQTGVDGTNTKSLTDAVVQGRKQSLELFEIMKRYFPGFQHARIDRIFDVPGIRESRRIVGQYTVTLEDALEGREYDDCIASTTYNFDLPDPINPNLDSMMGNTSSPKAEREHQTIFLPYRSLLPVPIQNLAVCGRCISLEREVLGAARVIGPVVGTGEAAGTASYFAHCKGDNYNLVDTELLKNQLKIQGILIP